MVGSGGAATVVIAQPDDGARELLARLVEAAGHHAVRLDASAPPDVVEATVDATANLLIVDLASVTREELAAMVEALAVRRFPAQVVALTDGPASGELALAAGAVRFLARPFHRRDLTAVLAELLDGPAGRNQPGDQADHDDESSTTATATPAPRATPAVPQTFTEILKMGRQL